MRTKNPNIWLAMWVFLLAMACTAAGQTIFVDDDATGANDGSSWADAFNDLQDALAATASGDEIRVAQGIYKPDEDSAHPNGTGSRTATFQLKNGVAVKGGYAGYGQPDPNAWDIEAYETVLSGDIGSVGYHKDNSYHVVTGTGTNSTAIISGFTITCGRALLKPIGSGSSSKPENHGGGMYNNSGSPTVSRCVFSGNYAFWYGGGMQNTGASNPTLIGCTFRDNYGGYGGGMSNMGQSSPEITKCAFIGNSAGGYGGGIFNKYADPVIINCSFVGNLADRLGASGAGIYNSFYGNPTLINCVFTGNLADDYAGGIYIRNESGSTIINCTFSSNTAEHAGGIWNGGSVVLTNCILWGNSDESGAVEPAQIRWGTPVINYCCVQGWTGTLGGAGNIGDDPCFVEPAYWDANGVWVDGDYHLLPDSPCIDAGTNTPEGGLPPTDMDGNPRPLDGDKDGVAVADMGAYEFTYKLVQLEIVGPDEVAENFSASYKAVAHYDNNSTGDVTDSALWVVEPNTAASIDENGMLTTKDIVREQAATILASYTDGDVTVEAEKAIDILAICPTGTALQFDGVDDYVDCGNFTALDGAKAFTVAFWIKADELPFSTHDGMVARGNRYQRTPWIWGYHQASYIHMQFETVTGGPLDGDISTPNLTEGKWHHIVMTWNGTTVTAYLDGIERTTDSTIGDTLVDTDASLKIGHITNYGYFNGTIDEVAIYNRALSAEEIWATIHTRLNGDEPGLVGYWGFDEGGGQIVYDLSGNGNDGQLGSTPNVDVSDPAWVDSDAPIGICSLYQSATMAVDRAVECKKALIEELLATLAQEWAAYEALEELLESGDYGDLNKGDIVTAKQKIHSAIQQEEQAIDALEKSIEKLKDALSALGYEPEPPVPNQPPNVNITNPQDGAVFGSYQTIEIEANAWDVDGSVVKVEFFANGSKIGEDNDGTDGWKTNWYDLPVGTYSLTAKATDNDGAATTSPAVGITVVELPPPGQASNPNPANGATGVSTTADLSWTAGSNAVSHNVYFGTTSPGTFRGNQTATTFDPGTMVPGKTYYWRIDEVNPSGTTTGTVWFFRTGSGPTPPPESPPM